MTILSTIPKAGIVIIKVRYLCPMEFKKLRLIFYFPALLGICQIINGQEFDSSKVERFSIHAQATIINQFKPAFHAPYSGHNSLVPEKESKLSVTSTLFLGARLWPGASIFINPEIGGGSGLSGSLGVAASTNGETYRIGDPAPQFEMARLFFRQVISLSHSTEYQGSDLNRLSGKTPGKYFAITTGKICVSDYFDNNSFNHDPRTQFMSWGLMNNAAWDFPANTRGYTPSVIIEYVNPRNELRYGFSLVGVEANGMKMNWNIDKAGSNTLEYTHHYSLKGANGTIRLLSFYTVSDMGNYNESLILNPDAPDIIETRKSGNIKYGFGINCEQSVNDIVNVFLRASWNDGKNETWSYTEIDNTLSLGIVANGKKWNRQNDILGIGFVISGISEPHRNYLKAGGYGFMLGDGNLRYSPETLAEIYYSFAFTKNILVSGAYQLIINPGYNKDRGPVNVFTVRVHLFI
jgi:high affinity Mn2+ porin